MTTTTDVCAGRVPTGRYLLAFVAPLLLMTTFVSCGGHDRGAPSGARVPAGIGYDERAQDLRVLSRDDCLALRDHQIELAVDDALVDAGGHNSPERLALEARLRNDTLAATEAWVRRCAGRLVRDDELRCMRSATSPRGFNACGEHPDAGPGSAGPDAVDATSRTER